MSYCNDNEDTFLLMEKNYRFLVFPITNCKWSRWSVSITSIIMFINGLNDIVSTNTCKIANTCNFSYLFGTFHLIVIIRSYVSDRF